MTRPSVLCATDFTAASEEAVRVAVDEALRRDANLDLVHVWYPVDPVAADISSVGLPVCNTDTPVELRAVLDRIAVSLPPDRVQRFLEVGIASEKIVAKAKELGSVVLVVGTHARGPFMRWFVGSVVSEVLRHSPCPVLVCRTPPQAIQQEDGKQAERGIRSSELH
ncbi:universal stress protein [Novipirellula artificiosorum]|uniref:Universal stress protein n=1 Tax=Novipirellula artificiosorum TaxID=2528016 RepID=A0A5C6DPG7_9BACT|nr:universal stress protein [Novipirellula artificiosorum]TWU38502.1 Universal stress protein [Novipirellula artificiosorum]